MNSFTKTGEIAAPRAPAPGPDGPGALGEGPGEPGLVSVVIPSYNRAYTLASAIDSALGQAHQPVEVIVVDDGSTDDTRRVVEGYGPRVVYLHQANAGVSAARNAGLRAARGEFVALLDSDDAWHPWKLAAQVEVLRRNPDVGMVWTDMAAVDGRGRVLHPEFIRRMYSCYDAVDIRAVLRPRGTLGDLRADAPAALAGRPIYVGEIFSEMVLGSLVHTSTVLLRRGRLREVGPFDESLVPGEDYEFHMRTCYHGPVAFLDAPSVLYRVGSGDQITAPGRTLPIAMGCLVAQERWIARGADRLGLSRRAIRGALAETHAWIGREALAGGQTALARAQLLRSLALRPASPGRLLLALASLLPAPLLGLARSARRRLRPAARGG